MDGGGLVAVRATTTRGNRTHPVQTQGTTTEGCIMSTNAKTAPSKPDVLPVNFENIPPELQERTQWLAWKLELRKNKKGVWKWTKPPLQCNGRKAAANDPSTWSTLTTVRAAYDPARFDGIGFVFMKDDPYCGIDLDGCRNVLTGDIDPKALVIITQLGSYAEVSPSGTGVKIFIRGKKPVEGCRKRYPFTIDLGGADKHREIEIYDQERYFTLTGQAFNGNALPIVDAQAALDNLCHQLWAQEGTRKKPVGGGSATTPDDKRILGIAMRAKNGDKFRSLWEGGTNGQYTSDSERDFALLNMLVFYTGPDAGRLEQLARQSSCGREKWNTKRGGVAWITGECEKVVAKTTVFFDWGKAGGSVNERVISNGTVEFHEADEGNEKRKIRPKEMRDVIDVVNRETDNGLGFANGSLFTVAKSEVRWLEKTEDLFAYLHLVKPVRWHGGECFVSRAEFRSAFIAQATQYKAIENYPHEPMVKDHFYLCTSPPSGDGTTLSAFLDFFCPETPIDRDLLQAALMTMAWGGPGGKRPAFLITAKGRGSGKTTAAEQLSSVFGGCMSFSLGDSAKEMKERLLSPESLVTRAAILDNIKTTKLSSGDIEGLITASIISGKRMYVGEASRPNTITWFITVNGAALSKDMAQRSIPIRVQRPKYSRDWDAQILSFVEENRQRLIADIIGALRGDTYPLERYSRWGMWERDVLEKLSEPNEAQRVIQDRQTILDTDADEAGTVWEYFKGRLDDLLYDTDADIVFIPSRVAIHWLSEATAKPYNATTGPQYLNQQIDEGEIRNLIKNPRHGDGRGYRWMGADADSMQNVRMDLPERVCKQQETDRANRQRKHAGTGRDW
jgi:putative DNA primase/helicase